MNEFIRVGFWTSLSTFSKILSYLFIVKIIAIYTGPEGLGKMGQFMSLMTIVGVCAGGGISNGIIRYVAEYGKETSPQIKIILNSGAFITVVSSFVFFVICFSFSNYISVFLFETDSFASIVIVLSVAQFCIACNNFLFSIINGFRDVKSLVYSTVVGSFISVGASYFLIRNFYFYGVLLSLIFTQGCLFFITLFFIRHKDWLKFEYFRPSFESKSIHNLLHYSLMAITTAILTPITHIFIRNHIVEVLSWTDAGYWQAVTKISDVYLLFLTTVMTIYYLPKLSELRDEKCIKKEIFTTYKILLPSVIFLSFFIYILRDLIVFILFDEKFYAIRDLFFVQLLGDIVKIGSWVIAFLMLAKKKTNLFLFTELFFSLSYVLLSVVLINRFSIVGSMYAFLINCSIYFCCMVFLFKKRLLY